MVTKQQAMTATTFHYTGKGPCTRTVGPRGGITTRIIAVRRSGKTQTWKRDTARFRTPVRYGLYENTEITQDNAHDWHTEADCPLNTTTTAQQANVPRGTLHRTGEMTHE
jgi:hypothetical protein